jgi:hypothetical protein
MLVACCFALALLSGAGRTEADTVFHDDFNGSLNPAWSIVRQNASYYSVQSTGLVLRCNSGDLWGGYNNALNVFLISNPAPGDFTVTAKLRWLVPPAANWAQFDLLAYDNDDNHVRLDYTYSSGSLGIGRIAETGGVISQEGGVRVNFGTAWFWLQMRKTGSTYSAWYSTNGVVFDPATSPFSYGDGTPAKLGFVAMVDLGGQTAQAVIDSFTVEDTPEPASPFALDWFTIDGGGGTLATGQYTLSGTIGQPDAGDPMTIGQFSLTGGFWALPTAVQSLNAPALLIVPAAPGLATISWTPATPGFVLQFSPTLTLPAWTNAPSGATNPITVPATLPARFYRLFKP